MFMTARSALAALSRQTTLACAIGAAALCAAAPVQAATFSELADAGQTQATAQLISAVGLTTPLTAIGGSLSSQYDVDLFQIHIFDAAAFSATTVGGSDLDTQLFLFTLGGAPVFANDDDASGLVFQSTLPVGSGLGPVTAGNYLLGISLSGNDPVNPVSQLLFADGLTTDVRGPASGLQPAALGGYTGGTWYDESGAYSVMLTGVDVSAVPEPATALLAAMGCGVVALRAANRRRRTAADVDAT